MDTLSCVSFLKLHLFRREILSHAIVKRTNPGRFVYVTRNYQLYNNNCLSWLDNKYTAILSIFIDGEPRHYCANVVIRLPKPLVSFDLNRDFFILTGLYFLYSTAIPTGKIDYLFTSSKQYDV